MVRSKNRKKRRRSKTLLTLYRAISQPPPNKMASLSEFYISDSVCIVLYSQLSIAEQVGIICLSLKYFLAAAH